MQQSMTLKQHAIHRFLKLLEAYAEACKNIDTAEGQKAFIALSVQLHIAKGNVPKSYWPLVRKTLKEAQSK